MAHGYLELFLAGKANVFSAGVETHGLNPKAVQIMAEDGVGISHHTSNHVGEYDGLAFEYVITVCDNARERCPYFPATVKMLHHNFTDPAKATGSEEEVRAEFRRVREEIKAYANDFAERYFKNPATTPPSTPA